MLVYADLRWPLNSGIGRVQSALLERSPAYIELVDLTVPGRIGSPFSPLRIGRSMAAHGARAGIFWSPGYMPPLSCEVPAVVTVHDLTHLHFYSGLHAAYYHTVMRRLYCRCDAVICVSEHTRREFLAWSGMEEARVFTVYNGVSKAFLADAQGKELGFSYVFYPGNRRLYKNLDRLLDAYAQSRLPRDGVRLVLTGNPDGRLLRRALKRGVHEMLHFAGTVEDEEMVTLYKGASAVAYVSLYEGFGLPILEAMAVGVPVVTSNTSSMPEVAGSAAVLVDPSNTEDITSGLERSVYDDDLRARLIVRGRARASQFDWDQSAAQVWDIVARLGIRDIV